MATGADASPLRPQSTWNDCRFEGQSGPGGEEEAGRQRCIMGRESSAVTWRPTRRGAPGAGETMGARSPRYLATPRPSPGPPCSRSSRGGGAAPSSAPPSSAPRSGPAPRPPPLSLLSPSTSLSPAHPPPTLKLKALQGKIR